MLTRTQKNRSPVLNGLRLRKWNSDHTGYEDEQIWMKDNLIVFTEDAWQHAKMAIGHIHDNELGDLWGVIADSIVGKLLAGENLIIMGTDSTGKKTLFRVDGSGMYAYNSRFWMESPNGGAFAVDPSFGLGLGQGNPFTAGSDGTIIPKCIDPRTGALKLDKDGFPVGMNFWAGMDGQLYIRGKVFATGGEFTGVVKAQDFLLPSGDTMVSILNRDKKIKSDWLDLMGINIKDTAGNTVMSIDGTKGITINKGSISWGAVTGTDEIDQRIQNAQDAADDAYDEASSVNNNLLKLVQGKYTTPKSTFIDGTTVKSPTIEAGTITSAKITGGTITGTDIYGGAFHSLDKIGQLTLSHGSWHDLNYETNQGFNIFHIGEQVNGWMMSMAGTELFNVTVSTGKARLGDNVIVNAKFA